MWATLWLTLTCLLVGGVDALPTGPPLSQCTDMMPQHTTAGFGTPLASPQTTPSPYQIQLSRTNYEVGILSSLVTVTVSSNTFTSFRGFFIQARRVNDDFGSSSVALGQFINTAPGGTQFLPCAGQTNSAWSHSSSGIKNSISATWQAPPTNAGPIRFRMTIVQGPNANSGTTYWTEVYSNTLTSPPIVACPSLTYASLNGVIDVPRPTTAGFTNPVTISYSQPSGNPVTLSNPSEPYHTIQGVDSQTVTVTASDGIVANTRQCSIQVRPSQFQGSIPAISCPTNRVVDAGAFNSATFINDVQGATAVNNFNQQFQVNYFTFPTVTLNPATTSGLTTLSGTFNLGTNYIYAYATSDNINYVACSYTVTVYSLNNCPTSYVSNTNNVYTFTTPTTSTGTITYSSPQIPNLNSLISTFGSTTSIAFPSGTTATITVNIQTADGSIQVSQCQFTVNVGQVPTVTCPTFTYASTSTTIVLPRPAYSGFSDPVTFSYSQPSSSPITLNNPSLPYHTIQGVNSQSVTVTVSDGVNQRQCNVFVSPNQQAGIIPVINCPQNRLVDAGEGNNGVTLTDLQAASVTNPFNINQQIDRNYLTFPEVILSPASPNSATLLTGTFNLGTNYIFAYSTLDNFNYVGCFYTVTVVSLTCPVDVVQTSPVVIWSNPIPNGFSNTPSPATYVDTSTFIPLSTTPFGGTTQNTFPPGTTSVRATVSNGISTASCVFSVTIDAASVTCPDPTNQFGVNPVTPLSPSTSNSISFNSPAFSNNFQNVNNVQMTYTVNGINSGTFFASQPTHSLVLQPGLNNVQITASDGAGTSATCQFTFEVRDAASVTCPDPTNPFGVNPVTPLSPSTSSSISFNSPAFSNNFQNVNNVQMTYTVNGINSGTFFASQSTHSLVLQNGLNNVQITASDGAGTSAICQFTFEVRGLNCPTVNDVIGTSNPALVGWDSPQPYGFSIGPNIAYRLNGQPLNPTQINGQPLYSIPAGFNTITATATSGSQTATCSFSFNVYSLDNCPADYSSSAQAYTFTTPTTSGFTGFVTYSSPQIPNLSQSTSGSTTTLIFPVGASATVTVTASDGNTQVSCQFTVNINQAPALSCQPQIFSNQQIVAIPDPTASGFVGFPLFSYTVNSQSINPATYQFPIGQTTSVRVTAIDNNANSAFCDLTVTVYNLVCPTGPISGSSTSPQWITPTGQAYTPTILTYISNGVQISPTNLQNGFTQYTGFQLPSTNGIQVTGTDANGNTDTCTFTVVITEAASLTCPPTIVSANPTQFLPSPTPSSGFVGSPLYSYQINGQSVGTIYTFPVGQTTTVTIMATDTSNNFAMCTFTVSIPDIQCPADSTSTQTTVVWGRPVATAFLAPVTYTYQINGNPVTVQDLGSSVVYTFPRGTSNTVEVTASDGATSVSCIFNIVVTASAGVTCPPNIVSPSTFVSWNPPTQFAGLTSPDFSYSINGNNIDGNIQFLNGLPTYSFTPGSQTIVTVTATDSLGASASCTFSVNTLEIGCPADIVSVSQSVPWIPATTAGFPNAAPTIEYTNANSGDVINPQALSNGQLQFPFPPGQSTTILVTATSNDQANTISCTFTVYVLMINCPPNAIESTGASVSWPAAVGQGFPGTPTVTYYIDGAQVFPTNANGQPTYNFPTGTTIVTATAADDNGNSISCTFPVNVVIPSAPVVTCPSIVRIDSTSDTSVSFTAAVATASDGSPLGVTYVYTTAVVGTNPVGNTVTATFPIGTTIVTALSHVDQFGATGFCQFTVSVVGLICPASPITLVTSTGTWSRPSLVGFPTPSGVTIQYLNAATNTPLQPPPTTNFQGELQYQFPMGTTNVMAVASDNAGNTAVCQFVVNFSPTQPTITCPQNQVITALQSATVNLSPPATATNSLGFTLGVNLVPDTTNVLNLTPFSGTFPLGTTIVTVTSDPDDNGLTNTCSFTIRVLGLRCPDPITGAPYSWANPTPLGFNPIVPITYSINGGDINVSQVGGLNQYNNFPVGTSVVRATATDANGNVITCVFPVTVPQPMAPTIICPQDQTIASQLGDHTFATFPPATATDSAGNNLGIATYSPNNAVPDFDISFSPHSGRFPVGTTVITVTSLNDANGLSAICTFRITVYYLRCPQVTNVQSSTVTFNAPTPEGFLAPNNVVISYSVGGQPIAATPIGGNQYQASFQAGQTTTVTATAMDNSGITATCSFTFTTPPVSVRCPLGPFSTTTNEIQVPPPDVVGFGPAAIASYSVNNNILGTYLIGTQQVNLIGLSLGVNIIEVVVTDSFGNRGTCNIVVEVREPQWGQWAPWSVCSLIVSTCQQTRSRVCIDPNPNDNIDCQGDNFETQECQFGSCGIAAWDPWSTWSTCTRTCGTGTRTRTRTCNDPIANDNDDCVGEPTEIDQCNTTPCVDWETWGPWSGCSVTCNGGDRTRTRRCIDDTGVEQSPVLCGFGSTTDVEICNNLQCPADPEWLEWSSWGDCSERCGGGTQLRTRLCNDPNPQDQIYCEGQTDLSGLQRDNRPCNIDPCPVATWEQWQPWTSCSATCNRGFRWRTRACFDPIDDNGDTCIGEDTETEVCNDFLCPVAMWEPWGEWSACSATCGTAVRTRYRDCDDPNPLDVDVCLGSASSTESCYREPCPFPIWRPWGTWSSCTATCGGGTRERTRTCEDTDTNPDTYCSGSSFDTVTCNTLQCQEATWTLWSTWSSCSETCGTGIRTRQRSCQNPVPGQQCPGIPADTQHCYIQECPDPIWLSWGPWAPCSVTCGGGSRERERLCSHPEPNACYDPLSVQGSLQTGECNDFPCEDPYWTPWTVWSPCSATCGGGSQFRTRDCRDPYPFDTTTCEGDASESIQCKQFGCPLSQWGRWGEWSDCSAECNGGVRERSRDCYNPGYLAPPCPGASTAVETCNFERCPEYWDEWGPWGQCSATCGPGVERRERSCVDPNPDDGVPCLTDLEGFDYYQTRLCDLQDCAGWSQWFEWSPCTASCGSGIRQRFRTCYNPNPFIFDDCPGGNTDTDPDPCNEAPCPEWNEWSVFGDCSQTCGSGTRQRVRTCYDPVRDDDATCEGPNVGLDPTPCNTEPCDGPVVGWSAWSPWTGCSRTCGLGLQQRVRTCNDQDRYDEVTCENGDRTDSRVCNGIECVFPEWNEWNPWTCSVTCGGGTRARFRTCNDPDPADEDTCLGVNIEQDPFQCNTEACPVPYWNEWGSWFECSASCGGGARERRRTCYVPPTLPPGSYCIGIDAQPDGGPCNPQECPVIIPPQWNNWGPWDDCSVTCGGGIRERGRDCIDPDPFDFLLCIGDASERDPTLCNRDACPQPPEWNDWQPWGSCSRPCGGGEQVRIRTCFDQQPNDGIFCAPGNSIQSQDCNNEACAAWSPWNTWTTCSAECGGGERRRERNCNSVDPEHTCTGVNYETIDCNPDDCPKEGANMNLGLIVGLIAAGLLLAAVVGAICLLLFCRRRPTVVYRDAPSPDLTITPPPSPKPRRVIEQVELVPEPPKTRWVARRVPGVRAVVREEPSVRHARTVRPALYVDGGYGQPRYVRSVGDRVLLDSGYGERKGIEGISNSFL